MTVTLYNIIQNELVKKEISEYVDADGNLVFFEEESQFLTKILTYDTDVAGIVDKLFTGVSLGNREYDEHFKRGFVNRFADRRINRQTVEGFRQVLLTTFLQHQRYINSVYAELDKFITQQQTTEQENKSKNHQQTDGTALTDNRSAFANLPQSNVHLDVDSTVMTTASDNTISRNKQRNEQINITVGDGTNTSTSTSYRLEELLKSNGLEERIYDEFDLKCFIQIW